MEFKVDFSKSPFAISLKKGNNNINLPLQDVFVLVDSTAGPVIVILPLTSEFPALNVRIFVQDVAGFAATNNITIRTSGDETINNTSAIIINTNKGFARCKIGAKKIWTGVGGLTGGTGSGDLVIPATQTVANQQVYTDFLGFTGGQVKMLYLDGGLLAPSSAGQWSYDSGTDTLTFESIEIDSPLWIQGTYTNQ